MIERLNLVPPPPRTNKIWHLIHGGLVLFLILSAALIFLRQAALKAELAEIQKLAEAAARKQEAMDVLQARVIRAKADLDGKKARLDQLARAVAKAEGAGGAKRDYSAMLAAIAAAMPEKIRCGGLSIDEGKGLLSGQAIHYEAIPLFAERLKANGLFRSVSPQIIHREDTAPDSFAPYAFNIAFELSSPDS